MAPQISAQEKENRASIRKTIKNIKQNITVCKRLIPQRPNTYIAKIAELLYDLGYLYWMHLDDMASAEKMFLQALEYFEKYRGQKKEMVSLKIKTMEYLVRIYNRTDRLELSEQMLLRILEQQRQLAQKCWWIYLENVAITQWQLGNLYVDMERFQEAEQMYLTALETRTEFEDEDPDRYRPATAQCQRSLGRLYEFYLHDPVRAATYYRLAEQ